MGQGWGKRRAELEQGVKRGRSRCKEGKGELERRGGADQMQSRGITGGGGGEGEVQSMEGKEVELVQSSGRTGGRAGAEQGQKRVEQV